MTNDEKEFISHGFSTIMSHISKLQREVAYLKTKLNQVAETSGILTINYEAYEKEMRESEDKGRESYDGWKEHFDENAPYSNEGKTPEYLA